MGKTILLIDDDTYVARFIGFKLSKQGYEVKHVDNGFDGLDLVRKEKPDLLILDMMMPGLDGREVAERIREEKLMDMGKILVLSGKEVTDEVKALFDLGIHDYLQKPFNMDSLLMRIERALDITES
ncbi:MAG: response regulator transcription factor [Balneolia bacterium]|nr:response regulator transcription factor [Balneolia bacterium]